jgi:hypothetical protein
MSCSSSFVRPARGGLQPFACSRGTLIFSGFCGLAMAAYVSNSGTERHAETVIYCFLGGCREPHFHIVGYLVHSGR